MCAPIGATAVVRDPGWRVPSTRATATGGEGRASSAFGEPSRARCSHDAGGGTPSSWGAAKAAPAGRRSRVSAASPHSGAGDRVRVVRRRPRLPRPPRLTQFRRGFGAIASCFAAAAGRRVGVCPLSCPTGSWRAYPPANRRSAARSHHLRPARRPRPDSRRDLEAGTPRRDAAGVQGRLHVQLGSAFPRSPVARRDLGVRPRRGHQPLRLRDPARRLTLPLLSSLMSFPRENAPSKASGSTTAARCEPRTSPRSEASRSPASRASSSTSPTS